MAAQAQANSVARPDLWNLNLNLIFDSTFYGFVGFEVAAQVFMKSFKHLRQINQQLFDQKWLEFSQEMIRLFRLQNDNRVVNYDTTTIEGEVDTEPSIICFAILEIERIDLLTEAHVTVDMGLNTFQWQFDLQNQMKKRQPHMNQALLFKSQDWVDAIQTNRQIVVTYTDSEWGNPIRQFPPFVLPYTHLHCEGFHQWLTFGTTRILFSVELESEDLVYSEYEINQMHNQAIYYALLHRLSHFRGLPHTDFSHIHQMSLSRRVTYERPAVDPNTDESYWGTVPNLQQNAQIVGPVKYIDLQIGFNLGEELVNEEFCTCNEFCNFNAFFFYNPILRFLLVQHNRLYIKNRTTIADMYLLATINALPKNANIAQQQRTPLIRLLHSAQTQLMANKNTYQKDANLRNHYLNSDPNYVEMVGLSYKILRFTPISDVCIGTDLRSPFFENSINYIMTFEEILWSLHREIGCHPTYVAVNNRKNWNEEPEKFAYFHYFRYIQWSFNLTVTLQTFNDNLFTEDYELTTKLAKTANQREQLVRWVSLREQHNIFNVDFQIYSFIEAINKLYECLVKYNPLFQFYTKRGKEREFKFAKLVCVPIYLTYTNPNFAVNSIDFTQQLPPEIVNSGNQLSQFYKLKIYSRMFFIQKVFCKIFFRHHSKRMHKNLMVFTEFKAMFDIQWIERSTQLICGLHLFDPNTPFTGPLDEFYRNYWGLSEHEQLFVQTHTVPPLPFVMNSVRNQYSKRLYWEQINGDKRQRFRAIINSLRDCLTDISTATHHILRDNILAQMDVLRQHFAQQEQNLEEVQKNYCVVLDELVYRLIRASCFVICSKIITFLNAIHSLEHQILHSNNNQYMLQKPGFISLFKTNKIVLQLLNALKTQYIGFSDAFDNISDTIENTKQLINGYYKSYFSKLTFDWLKELHFLINQNPVGVGPVMECHLVSGFSFLYCFSDQNRYAVNWVFRQLLNYRIGIQQNTVIFSRIEFRRVLDLCVQWLTNINLNDLELPFSSQYWIINIGPTLQLFQLDNHTALLPGADQVI